MDWGLKKAEVVDLSQRTQWYARVRLFFLLAIAIPGLLSLYAFNGFTDQVRTQTALAVLALASNLMFYGLTVLNQSKRYQATLGAVWITLDILLIGLLIMTNGGIESRSPILYAVPILIAAALFGRKAIYITALSCATLYGGLILSDYFSIIHSTGALDPSLRLNLPYVINTIVFFPAILLVIALAVDFITRLLFEKQDELAHSLAVLEDAQEIAKLGSWEWDIGQNEVTWSKELYRIYGKRPRSEKIPYETYLDMINPAAVSTYQRLITNALRKKTSFAIDYEIFQPDGSKKHIHSEGRPVYTKSGRITKMVGTSQDMTAVYHLDSAKREFVSLASHQLRTPASAVKAFLSLLLDGHGGKLTLEQSKFIRHAYASNDRQLEIIDNLLSLASIESGKLTITKKLIDIESILRELIKVQKPKIKDKKVHLKLQMARRRTMVVADASILQMAFDNILTNAVKYTLEKGTITVLTRNTKTSAYIEFIDTGIGIAKKDLPRLFQKFSRISDPNSKTVEGSGLGLYMAKYLVELHGGRIMVRSKHDVGSRFIIKLPLYVRKR